MTDDDKPSVPAPPEDASEAFREGFFAGAKAIAERLGQQQAIIASVYADALDGDDAPTDDPDDEDEETCPECGGDLRDAMGGLACPSCGPVAD